MAQNFDVYESISAKLDKNFLPIMEKIKTASYFQLNETVVELLNKGRIGVENICLLLYAILYKITKDKSTFATRYPLPKSFHPILDISYLNDKVDASTDANLEFVLWDIILASTQDSKDSKDTNDSNDSNEVKLAKEVEESKQKLVVIQAELAQAKLAQATTNTSTSAEKTALNAKINLLEEAAAQAAEALEEKNLELAEAKRRTEKAKASIVKIRRQLNYVLKNWKDAKSRYNHLYAASERNYLEQQEEIRVLNESKKAAEQNLSQLNERLAEAESRLSNISNEQTVSEEDKARLKGQVASLQEEIQRVTDEQSANEQRIQEAEQAKNAAENDLLELREKYSVMEAQLKDIQTSYEEQKVLFEKERKEYLDKLGKFKETNAKTTAQLDAAQKVATTKERELQEKNKEIEELESELLTVRESSNLEIAMKETKISSLKKSLDKVTHEKEAVEAHVEESKNEVRRLNVELVESAANISTLEEKNNLYELKQKELTELNLTITSELSELKRKLGIMTFNLQQVTGKLSEAQEKIKVIRQQHATAVNDEQTARKQADTIKDKLRDANIALLNATQLLKLEQHAKDVAKDKLDELNKQLEEKAKTTTSIIKKLKKQSYANQEQKIREQKALNKQIEDIKTEKQLLIESQRKLESERKEANKRLQEAEAAVQKTKQDAQRLIDEMKEEQRKALQAAETKLKTTIAELEAKKRAELEAKQIAMAKTKAELDSAKEMTANAQAKLDLSTEKLKQSSLNSAAKNNELTRLKQETDKQIEEARRKLKASQATLKTQTDENAALLASQETLRNQAQEATLAIQKAERALVKSKAAEGEAKQRADAAEAAHEQAKERADAAEAAHELKREELNRVLAASENARTIADASRTSSQDALTKTQSELDKTQSELDKTQSELDKTQSELDKTQSELDKTQSELANAQAFTSEQAKTHSEALNKLEQELIAVKETSEETAVLLGKEKIARNAAEAKLADAEAKLADAENDTRDADARARIAQDAADAAQTKLALKNAEAEKLASEIASLSTSSESKQVQMDKLSSELKTIQAELDKTKAEAQQANEEAAAAKAAEASANRDAENARIEAAAARLAEASAISDAENARTEAAAARAEQASAKIQSNRALQQATNALSAESNARQAAEQAVQRLEKDVESLKSKVIERDVSLGEAVRIAQKVTEMETQLQKKTSNLTNSNESKAILEKKLEEAAAKARESISLAEEALRKERASNLAAQKRLEQQLRLSEEDIRTIQAKSEEAAAGLVAAQADAAAAQADADAKEKRLQEAETQSSLLEKGRAENSGIFNKKLVTAQADADAKEKRLQEELAKAQAEAAELQQALSNEQTGRASNRESFNERLAESQREVSSLQASIEENKTNMMNLKNKVELIRVEAVEFDTHVDALKEELDKAREKVVEANQKAFAAEQAVQKIQEESQVKIVDAEANAAEAKKRLDAIIAQHSDLLVDNAITVIALENANENLKTIQLKLDATQEEFASAQGALSLQKNELDRINKQLSNAKGNRNATARTLSQSVDASTKKIETLQTEIDALKASDVAAKEELTKVTAIADASKKAQEEAEAKEQEALAKMISNETELDLKYSLAHIEIDKIQAAMSAKMEKIESLKSELKAKNGNRQTIIEQLEQSRAENESLKEKMKQAEYEKLTAKNEQIAEYKTRIEEARRKTIGLNDKLNKETSKEIISIYVKERQEILHLISKSERKMNDILKKLEKINNKMSLYQPTEDPSDEELVFIKELAMDAEYQLKKAEFILIETKTRIEVVSVTSLPLATLMSMIPTDDPEDEVIEKELIQSSSEENLNKLVREANAEEHFERLLEEIQREATLGGTLPKRVRTRKILRKTTKRKLHKGLTYRRAQ